MRRISSFLAVSLLLCACDLDVTHDYGVIVSWLINGVAPTEEMCRAHGIARVRFTVKNGDYPPLEGACGEGVQFDDGTSYGAFITTDSFDFDKKYEYEQSMIDEAGHVVDGLTIKGTFQVYWDDYLPWLTDPLELFEPNGDVASFESAWTVGQDTMQGCTDLAINEVALFITSRTDPDFANAVELGSAPCASGRLASDGAVLASGDYLVKYQAFAADGALIDESQAIAATVDQPGVLPITSVSFDGL